MLSYIFTESQMHIDKNKDFNQVCLFFFLRDSGKNYNNRRAT